MSQNLTKILRGAGGGSETPINLTQCSGGGRVEEHKQNILHNLCMTPNGILVYDTLAFNSFVLEIQHLSKQIHFQTTTYIGTFPWIFFFSSEVGYCELGSRRLSATTLIHTPASNPLQLRMNTVKCCKGAFPAPG